MRRQLILYVFFLCVISISCKKEKKYPFTKEIFENGEKMTASYISDSLYVLTQYYDNGLPKVIVSKTNNHVNDGEYISFYLSGNIEEKGNYKNGKEEGKWYCYSKEGFLTRYSEYISIPSDEYPIVNIDIHYNEDMTIDTTKQNIAFSVEPLQDTIYSGEPYLLNIRLYAPHFKDGSMEFALLRREISKFWEGEREKEMETAISCKGFEQIISIKDYHIGKNEISGVIFNYSKDRQKVLSNTFTQSFYVKELPHFQNDTKPH